MLPLEGPSLVSCLRAAEAVAAEGGGSCGDFLLGAPFVSVVAAVVVVLRFGVVTLGFLVEAEDEEAEVAEGEGLAFMSLLENEDGVAADALAFLLVVEGEGEEDATLGLVFPVPAPGKMTPRTLALRLGGMMMVVEGGKKARSLILRKAAEVLLLLMLLLLTVIRVARAATTKDGKPRMFEARSTTRMRRRRTRSSGADVGR